MQMQEQWMVYIDGSALPNPGRMSVGGVAYAPDGSSNTFSKPLHRVGCNNEAEALAAIHALRWLRELGAERVLLHTDNSILAEQMSLANPKRIERLYEFYEEARVLSRQFSELKVQWIPRHKNAVADALARCDPVVVE